MGLNERRKIKELQVQTFPGRVKEIEEICGAAIPYEVDWDSSPACGRCTAPTRSAPAACSATARSGSFSRSRRKR